MSFASPKFPATIAGSERNFIRRGESQVRLNRAYEFISHYTFDFLNLRNLFIICIYAIYLKLYISSFYIISLILPKIRIPIGTRLRIDILRNLRQFVLFAISKNSSKRMDTDFVAFSSPWKVLSHATQGTQVGQMTASYKSIVFETDQQPVRRK